MQLLLQLVPLFPHPHMQMTLHPLVDRFEASAHPLAGCLAFYRIPSFTCLPPVVGEAKKVECVAWAGLTGYGSRCLDSPGAQ
jgi:hypothetical protein